MQLSSKEAFYENHRDVIDKEVQEVVKDVKLFVEREGYCDRVYNFDTPIGLVFPMAEGIHSAFHDTDWDVLVKPYVENDIPTIHIIVQ